jgi:hypothetical protein
VSAAWLLGTVLLRGILLLPYLHSGATAGRSLLSAAARPVSEDIASSVGVPEVRMGDGSCSELATELRADRWLVASLKGAAVLAKGDCW